jgi:hypothetical protein
MAKSAADLSTMRVVSGEAGLSGSSIVAAAREIAHMEGTNLGRVAAEANRELGAIGIERQKVQLQALGALNDMGRQADQLDASGKAVTADQQRAVLARATLDLQQRDIERNSSREDLNYKRTQLGLQREGNTLSTQNTLLSLRSQEIANQHSAQMTGAALSFVGSGLQIGASQVARSNEAAARAKYYESAERAATNSG